MSAESDGLHWLPVGEVGEVRMGKQLSPASSREDGTHFPYLRVANVLDGWIDYSDVKTMGFSTLERGKYGLVPGDILLNEGQSLELVGRSAIYEEASGNYCFQNTLVRFRSGPNVIPAYAHEIFKRWQRDGTFASIAKKTTSIAHLGGDRFAGLMFPLIPVERQRRIVEILDSVAELERVSEAEMAKLGTVRDGSIASLLGDCVGAGVADGFAACHEVIKLTGGFPLPQARLNPAGRYPIVGSSGIAGRGDRHITDGPTIVIGRVGEGGVGSVRYVSEPAWVTDNALWARSIAPGWVPEFLAIYLNWCDLRRLRSQTGQPLITQGAIGSIDIPRLDVMEQQRIVRFHQGWEEERGVARLRLAKLRSLRSGIVDELLGVRTQSVAAPSAA